jgi:hypothetical protein
VIVLLPPSRVSRLPPWMPVDETTRGWPGGVEKRRGVPPAPAGGTTCESGAGLRVDDRLGDGVLQGDAGRQPDRRGGEAGSEDPAGDHREDLAGGHPDCLADAEVLDALSGETDRGPDRRPGDRGNGASTPQNGAVVTGQALVRRLTVLVTVVAGLGVLSVVIMLPVDRPRASAYRTRTPPARSRSSSSPDSDRHPRSAPARLLGGRIQNHHRATSRIGHALPARASGFHGLFRACSPSREFGGEAETIDADLLAFEQS